jgi:hypothetical protein
MKKLLSTLFALAFALNCYAAAIGNGAVVHCHYFF